MNGWMKTERAMLQSQYGPFSFSVRFRQDSSPDRLNA